MKFEKRGTAASIEEVILQNTGISPENMLSDAAVKKEYTVAGIDKFYEIVDRHQKIKVCGDYDVDGITSTYQMVSLLKALKKDVSARFPKRISEGFGLSVKAIEEAATEGCTLIVTVDNGITAIEAVESAKEKGMEVIITDHHIPNEVLPPADLIIDPNAIDGSADFTGYCGAGLVFKIIEKKITNATFLRQAVIIAAIGTVADSVPLIKDNRWIVAEGLRQIRAGKANAGITAIMEEMAIDPKHISEGDIAFRIGPALNAPGRLLDDGAQIAFGTLCSAKADAATRASELVRFNNQRKKLESDAVKRIDERLVKEGLKCPIIVDESIHEGIVGIVAGKLAEKYRLPAIVLTNTEEGYKGSARAPKDFHMKQMLDALSDMLIRYGGHAAAAGLTVKKDRYEDFKRVLHDQYKDYEVPEPVTYYDLDVSEENIDKTAKLVDAYGPYGEGNPAPVIQVRGLTLVPDKDGLLVKPIGEDGSMLRFSCINKMSALSFGGAARYDELGRPTTITAVGKLGYNYWNGWVFTQMVLDAFDKAPDSYLSLASLVKNKLDALRSDTGFASSEKSEN